MSVPPPRDSAEARVRREQALGVDHARERRTMRSFIVILAVCFVLMVVALVAAMMLDYGRGLREPEVRPGIPLRDPSIPGSLPGRSSTGEWQDTARP